MDEKILDRLKSVIYPGFKKSIVEFGFVKSTDPKSSAQWFNVSEKLLASKIM